MSRVLIVLAGAFIAMSAALGWMLRSYLPGATLFDIYLAMTPVLQVLSCAVVLLTIVAVLSGLRRAAGRVRVVVSAILILGVLGAGYGELDTRFGMLIDDVVNFATRASGRVQSLAILVLALFGAILGLLSLNLGRPDARD